MTAAFGSTNFTSGLNIDASDAEVFERTQLAITVFKCLNCVENQSIVDEDIDKEDDPLLACHRFVTWPDHTNPLFYPKVLGHHCLTVVTDEEEWNDDVDGSLDPSIRLDISDDGFDRHRRQWTCRCLVVDAHAGRMVERIVDACGLDYARTTAEEMDDLDPRLACLNCATQSSSTTEVSVFSWRSAVSTDSLL
jgi:hypothetical protein